jgi:lipopolysaccharide cholinephosphotransferase
MKGVATSIVFYKYPNELLEKFMSADNKSKWYYRMRKALGACFSWIGHKRWCAWYDSFVSRHNSNTKMVTIPTGRKNYCGEMLDRKVWGKGRKVSFNGLEVSVPERVEEYLTRLYGDNYMKLPPETNREKHFVVSFKS